MGIMDEHPMTCGAAIATVVIVVILLIVWAAGYLHFSEGLTASRSGISTGTSNHKSAGNNPMWAHGSHAAGGLISVGDAAERIPGVSATLLDSMAGRDADGNQIKTSAVGYWDEAQMAAGKARLAGAQSLYGVGGQSLAQVEATLGSSCAPASAAAQQDLSMARAAGSVNF